MKPLARFLLSLPGGVHFRRLGLTLVSKEDLPLATALVVECSRTLKCLYICPFDPSWDSYDYQGSPSKPRRYSVPAGWSD